jgi:hypothetical protein
MLLDFARHQEPSRFDNGALVVGPLRFNAVKPEFPGRQPAWNKAHTPCSHVSFVNGHPIVLAATF